MPVGLPKLSSRRKTASVSLMSGQARESPAMSEFIEVRKSNWKRKLEPIPAISSVDEASKTDTGTPARDSSSTETEVQKFFTELGSGSPSQVPDETKGGDDQEFESKQDATVTLYKVSDAGGKLVSEKISQKPLSQNMLVTDDCFILDTVTSGIYVWIGKKGTVQEKVEALKKAQLFLTEKNYPTWTKVVRVVEGAEPAAFREYFNSWQQRSPSPSRKSPGKN